MKLLLCSMAALLKGSRLFGPSAFMKMRYPGAPRVAVALAFACAAGCGGSNDPRPASWEYLTGAVIAPNCATVSCHSRAAAASGLDFSDPGRGFTSLTGLWIWIVDPSGTEANGCRNVKGTVVCQREHRALVVPFDPAQSRLVHMLRAENAPRMPPDRPLAEADIRLVERWILEGAQFGSPARDSSVDSGAGDSASGRDDADVGDVLTESPDGGAGSVDVTAGHEGPPVSGADGGSP